MRLRPAATADAEQLYELDRALAEAGAGMVQTPEQVGPVDAIRRRVEEDLRAGDATLGVVAEIDGRIVGTAGVRQLRPTRCRHVGVLWLGVHPLYHRRGIGRALMSHLIEHARAHGLSRLELYVRSDNASALALCRAVGFVHEATRARFVRLDDGTLIDDFIYCRFLE
jgi:ribosomal protein S18 acetylase RimI-like enzyme